MIQLTQSQRKFLEEVFNENDSIEIEQGSKHSSTELEKMYLEGLKENPDSELPSKLKFNTMTGIELQIKEHNEKNLEEAFVVYIKQHKGYQFEMKKLKLETCY